ncbi:MAG: hypothetical protein RR324_01125 [Cellulosilyticaceae bacterium]
MAMEGVLYPRKATVVGLADSLMKRYHFDTLGTEVTVLGCFAEGDEDGSAPVFVCVLSDGSVVNVYTEKVKFNGLLT